MFGSLSFAARDWLWPALALFGAGLLCLWLSYYRTPLSPGLRMLSFGLKTTGLGLLLVCLLEPMWTTTRPREGANFFAVVADNSMGLQIRDKGESESRGEQLRQFLTSDQTEWQGRLEETFKVRRYVFDARLQSSRDFAELDLQGPASGIVSALQSIAERFQGQPLAGVFLFTDGNATDLPEGQLHLPDLPPVYPVILGEETSMKDVALGKISVSQTAFEDAPVTINAQVRAQNLAGETVVARLRLGDRVVAEESQLVKEREGRLSFRFQVSPESYGISFYQLEAGVKSPSAAAGEATLQNNSRTVTVDRGKGPYRVLYVSGRPNWDYKFLNRSVAEDPQIQLVGLIRIARREPKFNFRGRQGESSNPLFRGFNQVDEETERYDQPVLIRLNTKDETELIGGFPQTAEDLYGFHAVVLDDIEAEFFTPDQLLLLQRYVSDRGGGFLMMGGADSLQDGKYARTPVGDMLPVYLDRLPEPSARLADLRLDLTREGWLQPWVRLRNTEQGERERLQQLPGMQVINQLSEAKPGASVLATVSTPRGEQFPALAVQRFGQGRVAVLTVGDLWSIGMRDEKAQKDLGKSWRQLMRWLTADVPRHLELRVEAKPGDPEGAVNLVLRARDRKFEPMENASVRISVKAPGEAGQTNQVTLEAEPGEREAGVYQATYVPRETGGYTATAEVIDSEGIGAGQAEAGWVSEPLAREFESLNPNRALLEEIARKTGGEVITLDEVPGLAGSLPERKAPIVETYSYPLWHRGSVFLLALGCFAAEWGLRRWKGLA